MGEERKEWAEGEAIEEREERERGWEVEEELERTEIRMS